MRERDQIREGERERGRGSNGRRDGVRERDQIRERERERE